MGFKRRSKRNIGRSRFATKDHRWKPAWKTDPKRVLGQRER